MMFIITSFHVIICIVLIMVVLLQAGKGTDMGSSLGGSGQAFFNGNANSNLLTKVTTIAAVIFMLTSLAMGYMNVKDSDSVMDTFDIVLEPLDEASEENELESDSEK